MRVGSAPDNFPIMTRLDVDNKPPEFEFLRKAALAAIAPIRPADAKTRAPKDFLFSAKRSNAGSSLPEYYLVYFLLVELLGFRDLGKFENVAWSIPIDFNGKAFLIEHRKFGVGVFLQDPVIDEPACKDIVSLIKKGIETAEPFFIWLADQAVKESSLNVVNESRSLFDRYCYFVDTYNKICHEAQRRAHERIVERGTSEGGSTWTQVSAPAVELRCQAKWIAQAAIDAFFSWTEHVFIHLAIITGKTTTGAEVAKLAVANWHEKFSRALEPTDPETNEFYEQLAAIKQQLRNFMAHGAFGKRGEAFRFHSNAGAVPVLLTENRGRNGFSITGQLEFNEAASLDVVEKFIEYLWSGQRGPARLYIQESNLPLILTMAADGTYAKAMKSNEEMEALVDYMVRQFDRSANMDW